MLWQRRLAHLNASLSTSIATALSIWKKTSTFASFARANDKKHCMTEKSFYRSTTRPEIRRVARNYEQICWREIDKVFNSILKFSLTKTWKSLPNRIRVGGKMCLGRSFFKGFDIQFDRKVFCQLQQSDFEDMWKVFILLFASRRSIKALLARMWNHFQGSLYLSHRDWILSLSFRHLRTFFFLDSVRRSSQYVSLSGIRFWRQFESQFSLASVSPAGRFDLSSQIIELIPLSQWGVLTFSRFFFTSHRMFMLSGWKITAINQTVQRRCSLLSG